MRQVKSPPPAPGWLNAPAQKRRASYRGNEFHIVDLMAPGLPAIRFAPDPAPQGGREVSRCFNASQRLLFKEFSSQASSCPPSGSGANLAFYPISMKRILFPRYGGKQALPGDTTRDIK